MLSIVNGGCRFALQARVKFIDEVRILTKTRILWNHGRVLLCLGSGEILYATFGVKMKPSLGISWTDPCSTFRGLECPGAVQPGVLDFSPRSMKMITIANSCSILERSQRFAILEWGLLNPEKIEQFFKKKIWICSLEIIILDSMIP